MDRMLYRFLSEQAEALQADVLTLHYIVPQTKLIKQVVDAILEWKKRPVLIGDAGACTPSKPPACAPL